jgi:hypothetical protein
MMGEVNDNATAEKHKTNQINIIIHKKKDIQKLSVVPQDSKNLCFSAVALSLTSPIMMYFSLCNTVYLQ